jgi:two-component system NtrC family sensor kinase
MPAQQVNQANSPSEDPMKKTEALLEGTPVSPTPDEQCFAEAQKGLTARPTMSIRAKIILGFVLLFLLCAGASITFLIMGSRINQKLRVMETVNSYTFELQQARRFEKNFFLYRTNLPDALENIQNAREILKKEKENITEVIGPEKLNMMSAHLNRYESLLTGLRAGQALSTEPPAPSARIEGELRQHGSEMIFLAANLVEKERGVHDPIIPPGPALFSSHSAHCHGLSDPFFSPADRPSA